MEFKESFKIVSGLVRDFEANYDKYMSSQYQESQVRQDFIDKFFTALGWDVDHVHQKDPYRQEVQIEKAVKTGGSKRRADYGFYIAPNFRDSDIRFFVEAKKPSRDLANADDYFQLIRYGWHKQRPIGILTDFEEFHIIDCRYKPAIETALERKLEYFNYKDYADEEKFSRIFHLFGRDLVADGSIENYAANLPKPKGKAAQKIIKLGFQPVDESFLIQLDHYREVLAKAFKKENQSLDGEALTEAVQRTLDRLVFIRFLEDKLIEDYHIRELVKSDKPGTVWKEFQSLCDRLQPKYNGLVFREHSIIDDDKFRLKDDSDFRSICLELSDERSPYHFDQIPISILGSIYERFLGKIVHATEKRVKIEEKPEVRKAGGVYYTPEYIVRYIVSNTVGKLIEGKTPDEIVKMAFADIACGSGSFLIEVYSELLECHTRYYTQHPAKAKSGDVVEHDGKLFLSLKKKKEILLNNIYGVDIDFQATEVTQLSLYLKLLEDVTMHEAHQFGLLKETILPDLKQNIVCGNSLIGTDMLQGELFGNDELHQLRPMNFQTVFSSIMRRGGFDAVVGNPPYIKIQVYHQTNALSANQLKKLYESAATGNFDIYVVFVERGTSLLKQDGRLGYILPHKFMNSGYGKGLRQYLSRNGMVESLMHFGETQIFEGATTYTCILTAGKQLKEQIKFSNCPPNHDPRLWLNQAKWIKIPREVWSLDDWTASNKQSRELLNKLFVHTSLGEITTNIFQGPKAGADNVFILKLISGGEELSKCDSESLSKEVELESSILRPYVKGKFIRKFFIDRSENEVTIYPYDEAGALISSDTFRKKYRETWAYLNEQDNKKILVAREKGRFESRFWTYSRPQNMKILFEPKILTPFNAFSPSFAVDNSCDFVFSAGVSGAYGIVPKSDLEIELDYLCGLLNSKLLFFVIQNISTALRGGFWSFENKYLKRLPIVIPNSNDRGSGTAYRRISDCSIQAAKILSQVRGVITDVERMRLEALVRSFYEQIDQAVYELYELTEEEIKIVEGESA